MQEFHPITDHLAFRILTPETWSDFEAMFLRHKGVRGGCWCLFHQVISSEFQILEREERHSLQHERVAQGLATGAILYRDADIVGWGQFGRTTNLEQILRTRKLKAWVEDGNQLPDWFVTCLFVDKAYRKQGLQKYALKSAIKAIEMLGGGLTAGLPFDFPGNGRPAYNGSIDLFEREGFRVAAHFGHHALLQKEL